MPKYLLNYNLIHTRRDVPFETKMFGSKGLTSREDLKTWGVFEESSSKVDRTALKISIRTICENIFFLGSALKVICLFSTVPIASIMYDIYTSS